MAGEYRAYKCTQCKHEDVTRKAVLRCKRCGCRKVNQIKIEDFQAPAFRPKSAPAMKAAAAPAPSATTEQPSKSDDFFNW